MRDNITLSKLLSNKLYDMHASELWFLLVWCGVEQGLVKDFIVGYFPKIIILFVYVKKSNKIYILIYNN